MLARIGRSLLVQSSRFTSMAATATRMSFRPFVSHTPTMTAKPYTSTAYKNHTNNLASSSSSSAGIRMRFMLPTTSMRTTHSASSSFDDKGAMMRPRVPLDKLTLENNSSISHSIDFRGDRNPPQIIRENGGFKARNNDPSLRAHVNKLGNEQSGYMGTTRKLEEAVDQIEKTRQKIKHLYAMQLTLHAAEFDDISHLFKTPASIITEEAERAVYGLIPWQQVVASKTFTDTFDNIPWVKYPVDPVDYSVAYDTACPKESEHFRDARIGSGNIILTYPEAQAMVSALEIESKEVFGKPNPNFIFQFDKVREEDLMRFTGKPKGSEYTQEDKIAFGRTMYREGQIATGHKPNKKNYFFQDPSTATPKTEDVVLTTLTPTAETQVLTTLKPKKV